MASETAKALTSRQFGDNLTNDKNLNFYNSLRYCLYVRSAAMNGLPSEPKSPPEVVYKRRQMA